MSQKFRDIKTKMIAKKTDNMSLIFRAIVNKREKMKGWIIRPCRDATS
jgi:hypothetical protein